ncbi:MULTISPECIES: 16S rRNA (guanine(527)-N(7))-methyltransferase RsmG [unclassified Paenibacillus]|uniref:16S rRNA (guanine(527)-N(7))-methyltransferase RsmG n=1 Tax=unclassified Paenibacillus TaxID=185978 RepID=UPI001AE37441|nr:MULTISPECIES: 16S rRNA (guanine(527)-N(7))-methyltransferase RsmG [unclassified Paenibacillus]MBP1153258.1 16S rRNA (guanine527-N7)-methyltransferase [Paenibacillus sp. PvP091]MBP1171359.1 16S rRNA (guanine527-N7)-methyltransferase [Paenibacillus sp. PvR098]MBP2442387.1 16S rRNA (guanine527-N7)-methyltransferase [Paenibacillus sp. PvP052]
MDSVLQKFTELLDGKGIQLTEKQVHQFELYYKELVDWNERMNLTGITEREQVYIKHFYDSLSVSFFVPMSSRSKIADIGSGAGFPSIPLKIAYPHLQVTIVDSLNKRIQFLNHVAAALDLSDVHCVHGRAEDVARLPEHRDQYDLVTARAVARMAVLNEFCLPFVSVGGLFVAMKGQEVQGEIEDSAFSLKELKGQWVQTHRFELPVEESTRHMVLIKKTAPTPKKYPRKAGTPLKFPLV